MKKRFWLIPAGLCALAVLLVLLVLAEGTSPDASIRSLPAVLWYLLTTLTTVGYGDTYPVTPAGRIIGAVFQLMSLGVLGAVIGMLIALIRGRALPLLRLEGLRGRDWYIFSQDGEAARCLARSLRARDGRCALILAGEGDFPGLAVPLSVPELVRRNRGGECSVFCLGDRNSDNQRLADSLAGKGCRVWCRTNVFSDRLPEDQRRFDPAVCRARLYWDRFPLTGPREQVVLIGQGETAEAILEQGLIRNVLDWPQSVRYHVFGDFSDFLRCRPNLGQAVDLDTVREGRDAVLFHSEPWNAMPELLTGADRILFCGEDEEETCRRIGLLRKHFPVTAPIHALLSFPLEGAEVFGGAEEVYTPELILGEELDRRAMALNDRYRAGTGGGKPWRELSDFARRSNLAAADHLSVKLRILLGPEAPKALTPEACRRAYGVFAASEGEARERLRRIEHERWSRFHLLNGWQYGPERDDPRRIHPLLTDYDALSPEDRAKDDYAWEQLLPPEKGSE